MVAVLGNPGGDHLGNGQIAIPGQCQKRPLLRLGQHVQRAFQAAALAVLLGHGFWC